MKAADERGWLPIDYWGVVANPPYKGCLYHASITHYRSAVAQSLIAAGSPPGRTFKEGQLVSCSVSDALRNARGKHATHHKDNTQQ